MIVDHSSLPKIDLAVAAKKLCLALLNVDFKTGGEAGEVRQAEGDRRDANFCRGTQVSFSS